MLASERVLLESDQPGFCVDSTFANAIAGLQSFHYLSSRSVLLKQLL